MPFYAADCSSCIGFVMPPTVNLLLVAAAFSLTLTTPILSIMNTIKATTSIRAASTPITIPAIWPPDRSVDNVNCTMEMFKCKFKP